MAVKRVIHGSVMYVWGTRQIPITRRTDQPQRAWAVIEYADDAISWFAGLKVKEKILFFIVEKLPQVAEPFLQRDVRLVAQIPARGGKIEPMSGRQLADHEAR